MGFATTSVWSSTCWISSISKPASWSKSEYSFIVRARPPGRLRICKAYSVVQLACSSAMTYSTITKRPYVFEAIDVRTFLKMAEQLSSSQFHNEFLTKYRSYSSGTDSMKLPTTISAHQRSRPCGRIHSPHRAGRRFHKSLPANRDAQLKSQ